MLPPAAGDTVSYLVSTDDMVDPCGCVFRYIGRQVRFCTRIMVRNVSAQMRSASQPHGCLTEHHPYPADPPSCSSWGFFKKGKTLHELFSFVVVATFSCRARPSDPTSHSEQITGRATKDASCAGHQREKSSKYS